MKTTNFDRYLKVQLRDSRFAARFGLASNAWNVKLPIAARRAQVELSHKESAGSRYRQDA